MSVEKVLSLDPGGSTGWALCSDLPQGAGPAWLFGVIKTDDHHLALWELMCHHAPTMVICEEFVYQRRKVEKGVSLELISREYIGITRLWCATYGVPFKLARLNEMAFWSDAKLQKLGLYSGSIHSRDATRHLLWYLAFDLHQKQWVERLRP